MAVENISKHITFKEATQSPTADKLGIKNIPTELELKAMKLVAEKCFEPLRVWYNKPIRVNSFFRNSDLNRAVKGSSTSQHVKGEAIDIDAGSKAENKKLFDWIKANLEFDQLLWEYGNSIGPDWVHVSYNSKKNRKQILYIK
jgi:zinc D-Ala-D-Ala carboxypeptidase